MSNATKRFLQRDRVVRSITTDGHFRVAAVKLTHTVQTAQQRHDLSPLTAVLLGRLMAGSALLSSFLKGEERIILEAMGTGPVGKIFAEAMQVGELRGYVEHPHATLDFSNTSTKLSDALGAGLLRITKVLYNRFEPVIGIVDLKEGDVSTDLAYYLTQSEQIPSAVILDVRVDEEGKVEQAGGLIVQAMPGAPETEITTIQENIRELAPLAELFQVGYLPDEILQMVIPATLQEVNHSRVDFFCRCSLEKFKSMLQTLGLEELRDMRRDKHHELVCQYCNEHYTLTDDEIDELIKDLQAKSN